MTDRPKRKAIPMRVKLSAALYELGLDPATTEFDHHPSLGLRPVNDDGTDYDPPQLDPRHIVPRARLAHARKTDGDPAIPRSGDKSQIAHTKRLEEKQTSFQRNLAPVGHCEFCGARYREYVECEDPRCDWRNGDEEVEVRAPARPKRKIPSRPFQKRGETP